MTLPIDTCINFCRDNIGKSYGSIRDLNESIKFYLEEYKSKIKNTEKSCGDSRADKICAR
jgi:hypothetical protein